MITKEELYSIIRENKVMDDAQTTFVVVDDNLRILYVNYTPVDKALQISPGDLLQCSNACEAAHGCGTHPNCKMCKLRNMVQTSLSTKKKMETDANFLIGKNTDYNVHAISTPFSYEDKEYSVVLLLDKTEQHREFMMERVFLHDLLNLSGAIHGILECIEHGDDNKEMISMVKDMSVQLLDEIQAQRTIIFAKNGMLKPEPKIFKASECIDFVSNGLVLASKDMCNVELTVDSSLTEEKLNSDKALVNRVLHNMVKNACEASPGTKVGVKGYTVGNKVVFSVHNDAVMPDELKSKIFIYGNTTKGAGRGLGTYSMKLIGENYLKGHVWFKSEKGFGTEFYFELDMA